jgi:hypothetical protein
MVRPQNSPYSGCAGLALRSTNAHPPLVSIVVEADHRSQAFYRQFTVRSLQGNMPAGTICYHNVVLKRLALQQGRLLVKHIVPALIKPLHTLWNEVIGFLFLSFAVIFGGYAVRYYLRGGDGDGARLFIAVFCTLLMAWFGISSFRRARKISRS